jgi:hypothetical protein
MAGTIHRKVSAIPDGGDSSLVRPGDWNDTHRPLHNFTATADPTATDDETDDYEVGSRWLRPGTPAEWVCVDASEGAAVWATVGTTPGNTPDPTAQYDTLRADGTPEWAVVTNNQTTTDPTAGDDSGDGYSIGSRWLNTTSDREFVCLNASPSAAVWIETTNTAGGSGSGAYAETIGDTVETAFTITHGLGTADVHVQVWDLTSGDDPILATEDADSIEAPDENSVVVTFSGAPGLNQ